MYDDLLLRLPENEQDVWDLLGAQFEHIAMDFGRLYLETLQEALNNDFHKKEDYVRRDGLNVVRYRNVSEELDNRSHFWEMGQSLVAEVEPLIAAKQLTPVFVQQWGKLTFCHGYIIAHVFDDSDDLQQERNRLKAVSAARKDAQHTFIARMILFFMDGPKLPRKRAEDLASAAVKEFIKQGQFPSEFSEDWFAGLLGKEGFVSTMSQRKTKLEKLREMAARNALPLPSVEFVLEATSQS